MKDKEMIEEMVKLEILDCADIKLAYLDDIRISKSKPLSLMHNIFTIDCRKDYILEALGIPEDSVVLSREEFEKLKGRAEEVFNEMTERMKAEVKIAKRMGVVKGSKETAEKFMVLRGYITKQFHKYHEARDEAESEYKKCKEEQGKAILNNDWHRCDAIMFILENIATEFDKLINSLGVEIKE